MRIKLAIVLISLVAVISCNKNNDDGPTIQVENEINEFVYDGLNSWYFYYDDVADLLDDRFESIDDKNTFINEFSSPEAIFNHLKHPNDRFSRIFPDYNDLNQSQRGISESFGYEFGLLLLEDDAVVGYVQYVLDGGPADRAGLERGDIFYQVNGTSLDINNFSELLFTNTSYALGMAIIEGEQFVPTEETIPMTAELIEENPVFLTSILQLDNGTKVGYLVYNRFTPTFHSELNEAFSTMKRGGATELVLDLRYNPGGFVYTSMHLAGMIYDRGTTNTVFGKFKHNSKKARDEDIAFSFLEEVDVLDSDFNTVRRETMNRMSLSRVFILTSGSTASASELIINGLDPYMDVILVGTTTVGKNEGSITLYDDPSSDFQNRDRANPGHLYAIQAIINRLSNAEDFTEYIDGFTPVGENEISEIEDLANMKPLGDPEEVVLRRALEIISPSLARFDQSKKKPFGKLIDDSKNHKKYNDNMNLDKVLKSF